MFLVYVLFERSGKWNWKDSVSMTINLSLFSYTAVNFKQGAMAQSGYYEWTPASWLAWGSATPITITYLFPHLYPESCSCRQQQSYHFLLPLHKPLWVTIHQGSFIIQFSVIYMNFQQITSIIVFTHIKYSYKKKTIDCCVSKISSLHDS